jgi:serine/threonine protein kinase
VNTISHYQILEKLGEGGMGVVYKARDTRLERFVALKLLPASKTADPARRLRFMQEARAASALNHPRIITIYEIDRTEGTDGADFIAMEFVPGRTLDQIIPAKGLRISEALKYAIQIADALAAAHAAGIVHRDLKPANVMVTDKGDIKVLDFGLAKLIENTGITETENTRTVAADLPHTDEGAILGTVSYMSPEQAEGKKIDARSDVFSFGVLLYEMLTGRRAFQGDTKLATLAGILNREPEPIEKANASIPRELARIVQRCLRKDPDRRAHSMQDLKLALEEIKEDSDSGLVLTAGAAGGVARKPASRQPFVLAALALVLVAGGTAFWLSRQPVKIEPQLRAVPLTSFPGYESSPTFSPDGSQMAFSWDGEHGENYDIYVQLIGSGRPLRLTTDAARDISPSWSPDGRTIAFTRIGADGSATAVLIPALGGAERELAHLGTFLPQSVNFRHAITGWSPDGRWLLANTREPGKPAAVSLVSVETGEKRLLASPPRGTLLDFGGCISPDSRALAFIRVRQVIGSADYLSDVYLMPLTADMHSGAEPRRLTSDNTAIFGIAWAGDGRDIVFSSRRAGTPALWRIPVSGSQPPQRVPVGDNVQSLAISARANRLVYETGVNIDTNIWRANLTDASQPPASLLASTHQEESPSYSPDGKRIAFRSDRTGSLEIWTCDADGSNQSQLTQRPTSGSPHWSPDSREVAFDSNVDGRWQIFVASDHGGQARQVTTQGGSRPSFSHDGRWIYFASGAAGRTEVWKIPAGGGNAVQLTHNGANNPLESDDGAFLYYNRGSIFRSAVDGTGETAVIQDANPGDVFALTHDGVYYRGASSAPGEMFFFSLATGKSRQLFRANAPIGFGLTVTSNGRWLLYPQIDGLPGSDLMLVENFH